MFFTADPVADACVHMAELDAIPYEFEHKCNSCGQGFNKGVKIEDESFCTPCFEEYKHIDFYRGLDLSDREIYELLNKTVQV